MKSQLFFLLFLLVCTSDLYSQQPKNDGAVPQLSLTDHKITYTAQIKTDTLKDKSTLFNNAEYWYKKNFETADNTLTIDNINDGIVSGTGIIHAKKHDRKADPGDIFFTIDIKAGRGLYAYKVYDIYGFEDTSKFYYSDMYNEERYPPDKAKWPELYRHTMLNTMNDKITGMIVEMQNEMETHKK